MTPQQIGLLVLQAIAWVFVLSFIGILMFRSREDRHRYKLYALRDRLLYLAASGKLSQDSLVFRAFYAAVTASISEVRSLTLYSFIRASVTAKSAIQKERSDLLKAEIDHSTSEIKAFVDNFAEAMMEITIANSPILRVLLFSFARCGRLIRQVRQWIAFPQTYEAYQTYRYFEEMHASTHDYAHEYAT